MIWETLTLLHGMFLKTQTLPLIVFLLEMTPH